MFKVDARLHSHRIPPWSGATLVRCSFDLSMETFQDYTLKGYFDLMCLMICLLVCVWRTHVCVFLCVCVHAFFYACVWVMCMALMRVVWPCNARHNPDMVIIMHKAFIIAAHRKTTIPLSLLRESIHSTAAKAFHMPCISCAMYFVDMPFLGVPHPAFSGEIWEADFSSFLHSES